MVTIRRAEPDDARPVARLHVHSWQVAYAGIVPDETLAALDIEERAKRNRERFTNPDNPYEWLVAEDGAQIVGFVAVGPYRPEQTVATDFDYDYAEVAGIYLSPPAFGRGIGRQLMNAALVRAQDLGWSVARLWVLADNLRARRFYERYGFTLDPAPDGRALWRAERPDADPVDLPEVRYSIHLPVVSDPPVGSGRPVTSGGDGAHG
jgi:ribosomal protein S18 acetylase RimI-like enzyme